MDDNDIGGLWYAKSQPGFRIVHLDNLKGYFEKFKVAWGHIQEAQLCIGGQAVWKREDILGNTTVDVFDSPGIPLWRNYAQRVTLEIKATGALGIELMVNSASNGPEREDFRTVDGIRCTKSDFCIGVCWQAANYPSSS